MLARIILSNGEQLAKLSDLSQGMLSIGPDLDALIAGP